MQAVAGRRRRRGLRLALLLMALALPVGAGADVRSGPVPIAAEDRAALALATARRETLDQRLRAIRLEAELVEARGRALEAEVEALAQKAGVSLREGWAPVLERGQWEKRP